MKKFILGFALVAGLGLVNIAGASNLVVNPGFETGNLAGWTQSGNLGFTGVSTNPHTGSSAAFFGPIGSLGYISQILPTTAGDAYDINLWLFSDGGFTNMMTVDWDGANVASYVNIPQQGYTQYTYHVTASTASTELKLGFRDDPGFLWADDISVEAGRQSVPEPGTVALLAAGLSVSGLALRRRNRK